MTFFRSGSFELLARQPLVEKPDPARIAAGRLGPDEGLDRGRARGDEQPLEDRQVEPSFLSAKVRWPSSVAAGAWRGVSSRQPSCSMVLWRVADGGQGQRDRNLQPIGVDQRGIAGRRRLFGQAPFMKNRDRS